MIKWCKSFLVKESIFQWTFYNNDLVSFEIIKKKYHMRLVINVNIMTQINMCTYAQLSLGNKC